MKQHSSVKFFGLASGLCVLFASAALYAEFNAGYYARRDQRYHSPNNSSAPLPLEHPMTWGHILCIRLLLPRATASRK